MFNFYIGGELIGTDIFVLLLSTNYYIIYCYILLLAMDNIVYSFTSTSTQNKWIQARIVQIRQLKRMEKRGRSEIERKKGDESKINGNRGEIYIAVYIL